jgi:hypothetical protein
VDVKACGAAHENGRAVAGTEVHEDEPGSVDAHVPSTFEGIGGVGWLSLFVVAAVACWLVATL